MPSSQWIPVSIIVNTQSQYDLELIKIWKEVLEIMSGKVSFAMYLYGTANQYDITLLCAINLYPYEQYYPFIYCMIQYLPYFDKGILTLDEITYNCAAGHSLAFEELHNCSNSNRGVHFFEENARVVNNTSVTPIVVVNNIKRTASLHRDDYVKMLCSTIVIFEDKRSFPWWIFTFMACVVLTLLVVTWIAKSDASKSLSSLFCTLFYEIEQNSRDNSAEEVLRLWQIGALGDEEEHVHSESPAPSQPTTTTNTNANLSVYSDSSEEDNPFLGEDINSFF